MSNWIIVCGVAVLLLLSGCTATDRLQTEVALGAAGFVRHYGTPEVAARLKEYPPYTFLEIKEKRQRPRFAYSSPAQRTIFVGDEKALNRYVAYTAAFQQAENIRRAQEQQQWAQTQQAMAFALAVGADAMSQQPVYQPPVYAAPPKGNVAFSPPNAGNQVFPTIPGTSLRDLSHVGPVGVVSDGKVYPTMPGTSLRDLSHVGPVGVVSDGKVYPTMPGTSLRDLSRVGPVGVVE